MVVQVHLHPVEAGLDLVPRGVGDTEEPEVVVAGVPPVGEDVLGATAAFTATTDIRDAGQDVGAVINGPHPGRASDDEITLFDGTGVGLQDLAVAAAAVAAARDQGLAAEVPF